MVTLKNLLLFIPLTLLISCTGVKEKSISINIGTVGEIYKEALVFAKQEFPESVLLGWMNGAPSIDRDNIVPSLHDVTGELTHWSFIFAKTVDSFSDGEVNDEDVFAIEFSNSNLVLSEYAVVRDWTVDDGDVYGDAVLAYDSDYILESFITYVEKDYEDIDIYHISYNSMMGNNELTVFTSEDEGYSGGFNLESGDFPYIDGFEIVVY